MADSKKKGDEIDIRVLMATVAALNSDHKFQEFVDEA